MAAPIRGDGYEPRETYGVISTGAGLAVSVD
jgi:hypothetical protein